MKEVWRRYQLHSCIFCLWASNLLNFSTCLLKDGHNNSGPQQRDTGLDSQCLLCWEGCCNCHALFIMKMLPLSKPMWTLIMEAGLWLEFKAAGFAVVSAEWWGLNICKSQITHTSTWVTYCCSYQGLLRDCSSGRKGKGTPQKLCVSMEQLPL